MSRAAAISAPRVETPTVKTIARSRRRLGRSSGTARTLEYGRFGAAKGTDGRAGAGASGAGGAAPRDARLLPRSGADGARADPPHAVAVPRPRLPALRRLRVRPADPHQARVRGGLQRPRDPRAVPCLAGPAPAPLDVALVPLAGLQAQRARDRGARGGAPDAIGRVGRAQSRRPRG